MRKQRPSIAQAVVKLNEGVSGEGNALVDLANLGQPNEAAIRERLRAMRFEHAATRFEEYRKNSVRAAVSWRSGSVSAPRKCAARACNCASHRSAKWSCSRRTIKCLAARAGKVISAAPSLQIPAYAAAITRDAAKVGDLLRDAGVVGRFALDFVVTRENDSAAVGDLRDRDQPAQRRHDSSFPNSAIPHRRRLRPGKCKFRYAQRAQEISRRERSCRITALSRLHAGRSLRHRRAPGVALRPGPPDRRRFHMLSALGSAGRLGLTAVGDSPEEARAIFEKTEAVLDEEARFDQF